MHILITGGAGFIGSNLVDRLLFDQNHIICFDNFDDSYNPLIKRQNISKLNVNEKFYLIEGDIRNKKDLDALFSSHPIDIVVHLAARAGVRASLRLPEVFYDVNVIGLLNLLEAMRRHNVTRLVFASSSSVYGNALKVPFSETDPVDNPISPYAASKKSGELLCHIYHHLYGFDVFCLRFFTVYGPKQRPDMGITQFIFNILNGRPITLFGDGKSQRDYTYIDDIMEGIIKSIKYLKGYELINLGESKTTALISLIKMIENLSDKKAIINYEPMQPGDVLQTYADISKAQKLLGYSPCCSIEYGLKRQIEWIKNMSAGLM